MPTPKYLLSIFTIRLFVLLVTFFSFIGCSTNAPAPVLDKSRIGVNRPHSHIVIPGDTLFSIAWRYGLKYEALAEYNRIRAPYMIRPSQIIRLDVLSPPAPSLQKPPVKSTGNIQKLRVRVPTKQLPKQTKTSNSQIKQTPSVVATPQKSQSPGAFPWRWPAYGALLSSFQSNSGLNKGIDIGGKLGEPVLAAAAGKVVYSGSGLRGYGKLLIVKHNETFLSAYAHNNVLRVKEGDFVKAGQVIAEMGSSGTDRVKLHFEIRRDGTPVDPLKFLPRR